MLPSESSYGLYTPVRSTAGIRRILKLKRRRNRKFTVVAASVTQVQEFFPVTRSTKLTWIAVARQVWPGPVSVVVNARLSVRVPDLPLLRQLARQVGQPLIASSANLAGQPAAFSVTAAGRQLDLAALDAIIDAGRLPKCPPSAVVQVTTRGVKVLRPGPQQANRLLRHWAILGSVNHKTVVYGQRILARARPKP